MKIVSAQYVRSLILPVLVLTLSGCMPAAIHLTGPSGVQAPPGIRITMKDNTSFLFDDADVNLTVNGVSGRGLFIDRDGHAVELDTVLSYGSIAAAAPSNGRGSTMEQFLLTILGVILVIGLAGLILYAAFRATDR